MLKRTEIRMNYAILYLLMELNMPALQQESFLEYHRKMLKDQENEPMKETTRQTERSLEEQCF